MVRFNFGNNHGLMNKQQIKIMFYYDVVIECAAQGSKYLSCLLNSFAMEKVDHLPTKNLIDIIDVFHL